MAKIIQTIHWHPADEAGLGTTNGEASQLFEQLEAAGAQVLGMYPLPGGTALEIVVRCDASAWPFPVDPNDTLLEW